VIPGVVPSLIGEMRGCSFRDRCGFAQPRCALAPPERVDAEEHAWRCILEAA
jgi:peptide/nickel transport system ATP-binding protein